MEFFAPFASESIITEKAFDLTRNETRYGRSIWLDNDPLGLKIAKGFAHFADGLTPGISPVKLRAATGGQDIQLGNLSLGADVGDFPKAIGLAFGMDPSRAVNRQGARIDAAGEFAEALTGLKSIKPQVEQSLMYSGYAAGNLVREASSIFNRPAKSRGGVSSEDLTRAYIISNEQRFKGLKELYVAIDDARTLGLSDREIIKALKKAKTSNISMLMSGRFKPFFPSSETRSISRREEKNKMSNPFNFSDLRPLYRESRGKRFLPGKYDEEMNRTQQAQRPEPPQLEIPEAAEPVTNTSAGVSALRQAELNKLLGI